MTDDLRPSNPDPADPGLTGADLPPIDPELASWLASDSAPPMPSDVWDRIEAALAAEPPFVAGAPSSVADASEASAPVADLAAARQRRSGRMWPLLAGAAGVALVGLVALPALRGGDAPPVADGPITAEAAIDIPTPDSVDAAPTPLTQGNEPQVADDGGPAAPSATAEPPASSATPEPSADAAPTEAAPTTTAAALAPIAMLDTGTTYVAASIPTQVTTLLATAGMSDSQSMGRAMGRTNVTPPPMAGPGLMASPEALHDCMSRLGLPESAQPLVVDHGTFDGNDAGVVVTVGSVLTDGTPADLHVVFVGMECAENDVSNARHFDLPIAQ